MGEDMVIKLQRKGPRTSCVPFKIKDNQIWVKTINNRTVNIAPYKSYYFSSNTYEIMVRLINNQGLGQIFALLSKMENFTCMLLMEEI